jgi:TolA-binding protein
MRGATSLHMGRITFTADDKHEKVVSEVQAEKDVESKSEAVRECISRYADLQHRVNELETELNRLRNEKRLILEQREENTELVEYVAQERTAEQRWREADLATRLKWKLFGMDSE